MDIKLSVNHAPYKPSILSRINRSNAFWKFMFWITFIVGFLFAFGYVGFVFFSFNVHRLYPQHAAKIGAYLHVTPGALIILLSPLQLFPWLRQRFIKFHRYIGITLLLITPVSAVGIMILCFAGPVGGVVISFTGFILCIFWLISLYFGYKRIRDKDVESHREWMIRYFLLAWDIVIMRVFSFIFINGFGWSTGLGIAVVTPACSLVVIACGELYIRKTRAPFQPTNSTLVVDSQVLVTFSEDFIPVELSSVEKTCWNTSIFTFRLPHSSMKLSMPPGHHVLLSARINGEVVVRPYTPIDRGNLGVVEFAIKRYEFGTFSKYIHDSVVVGDSIKLKGPLGVFQHIPNRFETINMIAGGSGITPMINIIKSIVNNPFDHTEINLLYFNNTDSDIILRNELDDLLEKHGGQFKLIYVVTKPTQSWTSETGRITLEIVQKHLSPPNEDRVQVLICGPHVMALKSFGIMEKLRHRKYNIHAFGVSDH